MDTYLLLSGIFFALIVVVLAWFRFAKGKSLGTSLAMGGVTGAIIGIFFLSLNEEAKNSYLTSSLKSQSTKSVKFADKQNEQTLTAVVLERVQEGSAYFFRLEGQAGKTFYAYSNIVPDVRWNAHKIKISYNKTEDDLIAISSFERVE